MENNDANNLLARLDERTQGQTKTLDTIQHQFIKSIDELKDTHSDSVKQILSALEVHVKDNNTRFERHDNRLKTLENWRWYVLGSSATIIIITTWIFFK